MQLKLTEKDLQNLDKQTMISMILSMQSSLDTLNKSLSILTEEVNNLRGHRFGRSSEKNLTEPEGYHQLCFSFNEAEVMIDLNPKIEEPPIEKVVVVRKRGKKQVGHRGETLKDIPTRVVVHDVTPDELNQAFPDGRYKQLPDEVFSRLEFHPAVFEVVEHHVKVYAGRSKGTFLKGSRPADLLRGSIVTPSVGAMLYNCKVVNAQPIHRLSMEFDRIGINLDTQTLCRWFNDCADRYLSRVVCRMKESMPNYHVMHADETVVEVRKDGRPAGSQSRMWVYRSGELEKNPFVIYEYQKTRKAEHPREFLKKFSGVCLTDGYQVYHTIADEREDLTIAGCWAHARRGFADIIKTSGKDTEDISETTAYKALQIIQTMSRYESSYHDMDPETRLLNRKKHVAPLVDGFFAYLKSVSPYVVPKAALGKAIAYCLNQESFLRVFLTDGYVPMTNNAAERSIRPFTQGRKNWFLIDTPHGARSTAIAYSIAETAKANHLKPYEYFKYLLEELPKHGELEDLSYVDDLLPWSPTLPESCRKPEVQN